MKARLARLLAFLSRLPKGWSTFWASLLAVVVGLTDYVTGFDLHVTAFYLVPVAWASWAAGRKAGLILSGCCTILFMAAGLLSRHAYIPVLVPIWNSVMLLAFFLGAVYWITGSAGAYRSLAAAQASLKAANEHLEETVQLRTSALRAEIAERQRVEQAKAEAERLLERQEKLATLGTLTAGIAHEIRNPLTSLKACLYTLNKHLQEMPEARKDTEIISAEISRLERIVQDALSFARPAEPRPEVLEAGALLAEIEGLMALDLKRQAIALKVEPSPELHLVGDSGHLKQVLINLVRNAAEAITGQGTVTMRARASRAVLRGRDVPMVALEVNDTGSGIGPDIEKRLFDPFFSTKETGTGLGLAIAARMVERQGGIIQYETKPGRGTTFIVLLPLEVGSPAARGTTVVTA